MVQFAYAVARCTGADPAAFGRPSRRTQATAGLCFDLIRRVATGLLLVALLSLAGWLAARALDSTLLGFVFADLLFLVGIALRGAVAPARGPQSRSR
ncbi:hypothetical protein [Sphingomonas sp. PR090111-T3T-6A]|uniref:hypothetical protein n=1 Tax=Sphingomonas sp. PR090111-T3T-6A TaxID=685778 RepID=UPI00037C14A9|nr:hypothetical protein [Sphingomonas sp. PR090111-T3T-6A]